MALQLIHQDLTEMYLEPGQDQVISCAKFPVPFFIVGRSDGKVQVANLFEGDLWSQGRYEAALNDVITSQREISKLAFDLRFTQLHWEGKQLKNTFSVISQPSLAIQMERGFGFTSLDESGFVHVNGSAGDYFVQAASGKNSIYTPEEFSSCFQITDISRPQVPDIELLRSAIKKALSNGRAFNEEMKVNH